MTHVVPKLEIYSHLDSQFHLVTDGLTQEELDDLIDNGQATVEFPAAITIPPNTTGALQIWSFEVYEGGEPTHISTNVFVDPAGVEPPPEFLTQELLSDVFMLDHEGGTVNLTVVINVPGA